MTQPATCDATRPGVLLLDDEVNILKSLSRLFRTAPYDVHTATSAREALEILERSPVQVVISDQRMPGTTGVNFLDQVRERWPDIIRIILTGYTEMSVAVEAVNQVEIFRLLTKPWNDDELRSTVQHALDTYNMRREIERLNRLTTQQNETLQALNGELVGVNRTLENRVAERTEEVRAKHRELRRTYRSTLRALAEAIEAKDPYTRGHSERVGVYASRIAREMSCENAFIERIYLAGLLHDIGKIGVPDGIITKPGPLTPEEYLEIQRHPEIGARILEEVDFLDDIVDCVRHHHEWYDGSARGYPDRLSGERIPLPSRIILVSDTVEAMTSDRPYRKGLPMGKVVDEVQKYSGTQFDPTAADAFLRIIEREGDGFIERASKFDIDSFVLDSDHPDRGDPK